MAVGRRAPWLVPLCLALLQRHPGAAGANDILPPQGEADYALPDYRGKGCIDDKGFVFDLGERFYPTALACPCVCTALGPVCREPRCPRLPARCVRVSYRACCPRCLRVRNACHYGGQTYKLYQEFRPSACEKCRCEADRQVYCRTAECPPVYCVNPSYEPNRCCPVCRQGPNCFAGTTIIPAGVKVEMDGVSVCFCPYKDGSWEPQQQAVCSPRGWRQAHLYAAGEASP